MCSVQGFKFQMLQPILETFDLEGIASHIKKGDRPQNLCPASLPEQPLSSVRKSLSHTGKAQKIVFMCGAGISVSAGEPPL